MAIKIQLRRDLAANWTNNNPLLLNGEVGIETDTLKIKIGNGINRWNSLPGYAFNPGQPNGIATLNSDGKIPLSQLPDQASLDAEAAQAIANALSVITTSDIEEGSNSYFTNARAVNAVAGMFDPIGSSSDALDEAKIDSTSKVNNALVTASEDAADQVSAAFLTAKADSEEFTTAAINSLTTSDIEEGSRLYFTTPRVESIVGPLISDTRSYVDQEVASTVSYVDSALASFDPAAAITSTSDVPEGANLYFTNARAISATNAARTNVLVSALTAVDDLRTEINNTLNDYIPVSDINVSGGISGLDSSGKIQASSVPDSIARLSGPSFTGDLHAENISVSGNLTVNGTTTTVSTQDLVVSDPLIYIGEGNSANLVDLGLVSSFNDGTYQHSGIVRDASDGKWKIFKGVIDEPTTTINFSQGSLDSLQVGGFESSSATIGSVTNEEIQRLSGVTSNIQSQFDNIVSAYATTVSLDASISSANTYTDNAINGISNSLEAYALASDRNANNGYAGLDSSGKILESAVPSISNSMLTNSSITINGSAVSLGGSVITGYTNGISGSNINKITYGTNVTPPSSGNSAGDIYIQY
jgi:hypothetical protein